VRERFRKGVTTTTQGRYNFVLGGHSHVQDVFQIATDSTYINNGYALGTQTFIHLDNEAISFPRLS
jgi:hypothetical protein